MKNTLKRLTALLLALSMCLSLLSVNVWATEPPGDESPQSTEAEPEEAPRFPEEEAPPPEGKDGDRSEEQPEESSDGEGKSEPAPKKNKTDDLVTDTTESEETVRIRATESPKEDLFLGYLEQQTEKDGLKTQDKTKCAGDKLTGVEATLYRLLQTEIAKVAAGERASTEFTFSAENLGLQFRWTEAELGGVTIAENVNGEWKLTQAAKDAAQNKAGTIDYHSVYAALRNDHPYEYYWQDYSKDTISARYSRYGWGTDDNGQWYITYECELTVQMPVYSDYAAGAYTVNTTIAQNAKQTVTCAQEVVDAHANKSDYEKLVAYRQYICDQVTYNQAAANHELGDIGNPWQLIWVFDNDPDTNVVCEGYSKAFQFLCDLSNFRNNAVYSICASGTMTSGDTSGNHMWNILHMEDGNNYLADVTNCDGTSIGAPAQLFLAGATSGSYADGYTYTCQGGEVTYTYGVETPKLYSEDELTMSTSAYQVPEQGLLAGLIDRIEVGNIARFTRDRFECGEGENSWWKLDCWPGGDNLTVVLKDETEFQLVDYEVEDGGDDYDPMQAMSDAIVAHLNEAENLTIDPKTVHLGWDSDEQRGEEWGAGNYKARILLTREPEEDEPEDCFIQSYGVQVVELQSIEAEGFMQSIYDRCERDEDDPNNGKVECWPNGVRIIINEGNGVEKSFPEEGFMDADDIEEELRDGYPHLRKTDFDWRSDESDEKPAEAGTVLKVRFFLWPYYDEEEPNSNDNIYAEYDVTLTDGNPFASATVADLTRYVSDRDDEGKVNCDPREDGCVTVTLQDEGTFTGNRWKVEQQLREDCGMDVDLDWETDENPDSAPWTARETPYTATLVAHVNVDGRGKRRFELCTYTVNVVALPEGFSVTADMIEVDDTYVWENAGERNWDWDEDEAIEWYSYDAYPRSMTITLDAQHTFSGDMGTVEDQLNAYLKTLDEHSPGLSLDWNSDQWEENKHWEVGNNYKATLTVCGVSKEYNVLVRDHPIAKVDVSAITRLVTDREKRDKNLPGEDDGEWYLNQVDCWPDEITVTLKDGFTDREGKNTYTGKVAQVRNWLDDNFGFFAPFEWDSSETALLDEDHPAEGVPYYDGNWTAGSYPKGAWIYIVNYEDDDSARAVYDVTVVDPLVTSVEVDDLEVYETQWNEENYWDEDRDEVISWQRLDCWPERISVTTRDNNNYSGSPDEVCEWLEEQYGELYPGLSFDGSWNSEQDEAEIHQPAVAGDHLDAWFQIGGCESEAYTVTVKENPIKTLTVDKIVRLETDRDYRNDYDDKDIQWSRIDCWPDTITVKTDKQTKIGNPDEVCDWLRETYYHGRNLNDWDGTRIWWESEERPQTGEGAEEAAVTWTAGNTYNDGATFHFAGTECDYDVEVVPNFIKSIQVDDFSIYETQWDNDEYWDEDREEDISWQRLDCWPERITVTVTATGTDLTKTGSPDEVCRWLKELHPGPRYNDDLDSSQDETHSMIDAGGKITARYFLCNIPSNEYTVSVESNPIESLVVNDITRLDSDRDYRNDYDDKDIQWSRIDCWPDTITVKTDKQTKIGNPDEVRDWLEEACYHGRNLNDWDGTRMWWESEERPQTGNKAEEAAVTWTAGNTYNDGATFHFAGSEDRYAVTVTGAPDLSIEVADIYRLRTDRCDGWDDDEDEGFQKVDCWPEEVKVTINGTEYKGDLNDIEEQLRKVYPDVRLNVDWFSDERAVYDGHEWTGDWQSGDHRAWVSIMGREQDYTVHVVDINSIISDAEIAPVNITADYRRPIGDDTNDDGRDDRWWNRLDCYPNSVCVKLKGELEGGEQPFYLTWDDGQNTAHLNEIGWRLENYLRNHSYPGIRVRTDWWNDEKPDWNGTRDSEGRYPGDWGADEHKNGATASIGGFTKTYDVNVTDNPIVSVSVAPITRFETDRERVWDDENQRHWEGINVWPDTEITVTLRDDLNSQPVKGYLYVGADEELPDLERSLRTALAGTAYEDLEFRADWVTTETYNNQPQENGDYVGNWHAGDEGTARFSLCGVWCDYNVKLIPNPVTRAAIDEQVIPHDRTFEDDGWNYLDCSPINGTVKIWLTGDPEDSPSITIQPKKLEDNENFFDALHGALRDKLENTGRHFPIYWRSAQERGETWNHGKYPARLFIFGRPFNYTVLVNDTAHEWDEGEPVIGGSMRLYHCPCGETKSVPVMDVADDVAPGDLTGEGDTTMADVILGNQVVVGLIEVSKEDKKRLDVTGDNDYTMADVVWTNGFVLGKHTTRTKEQS